MAIIAADIRTIMTTTKTDPEIDSFVGMAALVVSEQLTGKGLSEARLDIITKFLTAHLITIAENNGGVRRARIGDADESYVAPVPSKLGGLGTTHFGQQALALDTSGTLVASQANSGLKAQLRVV